jgi:hypothetical protein
MPTRVYGDAYSCLRVGSPWGGACCCCTSNAGCRPDGPGPSNAMSSSMLLAVLGVVRWVWSSREAFSTDRLVVLQSMVVKFTKNKP